ncbi:sororin [Notolabrus celidotus]|uniref:sororin n=1 Tax=Notolabrus celidotus TaxID=1203425 RepID=UPI00148F84B6|nr:sororin [Notolabrus celidotus]
MRDSGGQFERYSGWCCGTRVVILLTFVKTNRRNGYLAGKTVTMDEKDSTNIMAENNGTQRRRSQRLSSPPQANIQSDNKMALLKRSITVRKIAPRKTVAPSENNKENTPRRSGSSEVTQKKPKVSTPDAIPVRGPSSSAKRKKKAAMPSPILPSSPPPASQPVVAAEDLVWSQKVRRSYSRLSDKSFNSPNSRETMFGFEKLTTPVVIREVRRSKPGLEVSGSLCGLNSFTSMLEAEDCASEVDTNIPGVVVVKEKRKRRKVQKINTVEVDALAAQMNAEFDEAEVFELVVE